MMFSLLLLLASTHAMAFLAGRVWQQRADMRRGK